MDWISFTVTAVSLSDSPSGIAGSCGAPSGLSPSDQVTFQVRYALSAYVPSPEERR